MVSAKLHAHDTQGFAGTGIGSRRRGRRVDLRSGRAQLEPTFSREEVMAHLGIGKDKLLELQVLGRQHKGCHPTKGGLYPVHRVSHKCLRIPEGAIARHLEHMRRLQEEPMFAAAMRARARGLEGAA